MHIAAARGMRFRKYKLTIEDAGRLQKVWSIRISRMRLVCTLLLVMLLCMGVGAVVVFFTPVKRNLPGYISSHEREQVMGSLGRLDTLSLVVAANQAYVENVMLLLDTDRESTDSVNASAKVEPLPLDSLKSASPAEREFVAVMEERDKYNLNVLSPVAADGVIFANPTDGGIIAGESRKSQLLQIIVPAGMGINAIADGHVIDRQYDPSAGTYALLVQSRRGFLTRYSSLGAPLVDKGDAILAGQCISLAPQRQTMRNMYVGIEMWREGTPLVPGDYLLRFSKSVEEEDIAAPRGR